MDPIVIGLVYAVAGSVILCLALKLFKVEFKLWQPILASVVAGLCAALIPNNGAGIISLVALLATMKFTTDEDWEDLMYPVFITRFALVPVLMMFGTW
ncbi:hypothetical protein P3339_18885 [Microbulbifer sp. MLAF003]|uniref:hypothetical protein n=1 Tax=unclassified Microbulbifer TaxID=2619833 RepID=UPI0024AE1091|nr:hypothetical protein [Microbulbifer sp. MLAF003]WHI50483.1 hypothetical protein P3339_18885 [Microbulbifer sp. MLAF003]